MGGGSSPPTATSSTRRPKFQEIQKEAPDVASSTDVRPKITLACEVCKHRNYITKKNRRNDPDRLEIKKFCPNCGKHQAHKESRGRPTLLVLRGTLGRFTSRVTVTKTGRNALPAPRPLRGRSGEDSRIRDCGQERPTGVSIRGSRR